MPFYLSPLLLVVLLLLTQCPSCEAKVKECKSVGEVITLDRKNFYQTVMPRKDKWLLYFHAPW